MVWTVFIKTAEMPMAYVARVPETDEPRGMMKTTVGGDIEETLGFTCLDIEGRELMAVVQMAMVERVTW
jgi:pyruvate/2-oxoglutarate dehydrogenase complex dihydrolipoamide dehydrogenase (E3) component